jgi:hypothetical protein
MTVLVWVALLAACAALAHAAGDSYQPRYYKPLPRPLNVKYITANAEESSKKRTGDKSAPFAIEDLMDASAFNKSLPGTIFLLGGGAYKLGARLVFVCFVKFFMRCF